MRVNENIEPGDSCVFDVINFAYAGFISFIYAMDAYRSTSKNIPKGQNGDFGLPRPYAAGLSAGSSFTCNFLLATVFAYSFANFLKNIWYNKSNPRALFLPIFSLLLAGLPGLAGFDLGAAGAASIWDSKPFILITATLMTLNMFSTRTFGIDSLLKKGYEVFIEPFEIRKKPDAYISKILEDLIEEHPAHTLPISLNDYRREHIAVNSLDSLVKAITSRSDSISKKMFKIWNWVRKGGSLFLVLAAMTIFPLWKNAVKRGFNDIHNGLGDTKFLGELAAFPHTMFYVKSASQLLYMLVDRLLVPLGLTLHNSNQSILKNFFRIFIGLSIYTFSTQMLAYESGAAMGIEASGINLQNDLGGLLSFLDSYYSIDVKALAGAVVNGYALLCFVVFIVPPIINRQFPNTVDSFLLSIGAKDKDELLDTTEGIIPRKRGEENIFISKFEIIEMLSTMWKKLSPETKIERAEYIETILKNNGYQPCIKYLGIFNLKSKYEMQAERHNTKSRLDDSEAPLMANA